MSKKHLGFIVALTIIAMLLWIGGEVLIVAVFNLGGKASIWWTVFMVVATVVISVWKGFKDDNDQNSRKW